MTRLWIISELFPPDETSTAFILGEIANVMTRKYEVKVISGPEIYDKRKKLDNQHKYEVSKDVEVLRVKGVDTDKNTFKGKATRFAVISYQLYQLAKQSIKKDDKVLLVTNPAPVVAMVSRLKKKIGFELNILVHDVFPENTAPAGLKLPKPAYTVLKSIFDNAYGRADQLIALGRDMKEVLEHKVAKSKNPPRVTIIENWADLDIVSPIEKNEEGDRAVVLEYAGNIGRVQGLQEMLQHLKVADNQNLSFHLWGTGAEEGRLKAFVETNGMDNVEFHGAYFRSKQCDVINSCDIALVTLTEGMYGLGVPSKTYNIMAAGKPVLFIGDARSEIALLVKENEFGYVFEPEEHEKIVDFLLHISVEMLPELKEMGAKARKVVEEEYSKEIILNKFLEAI